jgi:hypothetical protein
VVKGGTYVYGGYPDIDALFQQQEAELDLKRREATLHEIQRLVHDRAIYVHLWQLAFLNGAGPRVGESGLGPDRRACLFGSLRRRHAGKLAGGDVLTAALRCALVQAGPVLINLALNSRDDFPSP